MKIACVGTDPAGLYLGVLLKAKDPSHVVRFIDLPQAAAPIPAILCNPLKPRLALDDAETFEELEPELVHTDRVAVRANERVAQSRGLRYALVDLDRLTRILRRRAAELGCEFDTAAEITSLEPFADADLIVAADGADSRVRALATGFAPALSDSITRFMVFDHGKPLDTLTYRFCTTVAGIVHAYGYPRRHNASSFIVEAREEVIRTAGLEQAPAEDVRKFCRDLFGVELAGGEESTWRPFCTVRNPVWHAGNVVLIGAAAYTAHFSVGLDVRASLYDAQALATQLGMASSVSEALANFEAARRPKAESLQRAAGASLAWFENAHRYFGKPFEQFVFSLLTASMRLTYGRIEKAAPDLVRTLDARIAGGTNGANRPPPPMFAPIKLRELTIPNRVAVSPMCQYSATDGTVNDWHLVHLGSRAVGGAGLVVTEMTDVLPEGRISLHCAGMYREEHVPAWKRVVDFVHANSASKIAIQLAHAGRKGSLTRSWEGHKSLAETRWQIIAPSPIAFAESRQVPREMVRVDMDRVRNAFVRAAEMSERAGFDMIELHFAHGYLISSFISPLSNKRRDDYGGTLANRMRFPLEVFDAVRKVWPAGKPISVRISAIDWLDGGTTIEEAVEIGRLFHLAGNDMLVVSSGGVSSAQRPVDGRVFQAMFSDQIRNELDIPTMAVGGIVSHGDANTLIAAGRADMVALARGYLEDAYFARHAATALNYGGMKWPSQYRRAAEVQLRGE